MQLPVAPAHTITSGTTTQHHHKCEVDGASILLTKKLEQLQRATCRQFQCLPERTAAVAIYTLIGAEPIETTLDKNAMILFTTLARLDSSIQKDILIWEMENSKEEDRFFICRIRKIICHLQKKY